MDTSIGEGGRANRNAPPPLLPPPLRYDTRKDMKFSPTAPVIGLVLQRSHLVTGDAGHYDGVVSELEARGAKVGLVVVASEQVS